MRIPQVIDLILVEFNFVNPVFAGNFEMKYRNHEIFNSIIPNQIESQQESRWVFSLPVKLEVDMQN